MLGSLHRIARLVRLGLACLVLAAAVTPAHAVPRLPAAVMLSVARLARVEARAEAAPSVQREQVALHGPWERLRTWASVPLPATRTAGPTRRLFLAHRALLR